MAPPLKTLEVSTFVPGLRPDTRPPSGPASMCIIHDPDNQARRSPAPPAADVMYYLCSLSKSSAFGFC